MPAPSREFQIFVKPVGAECNLQCTYCYYTGKKALYSTDKSNLMEDDVLEQYIVRHIEASTGNVITFSWHGGEPLLSGIDFFRKIVAYQRRYQPPGKIIVNGIQTNGTLLNDRWCKFLSAEKFNIGISIDGPPGLHNMHRIRHDKGPTFDAALSGYRLLGKWKIPAEILCVVNAGNVNQPLILYNFFKEIGAKYLTFLPLVEYVQGSHGTVSPDSVPAGEFGNFLKAIFDEWVVKDIGNIKIQIFEEAVRTAFDQDHTLCIFKENCGGVPVIELNGDLYCCDHYVDAGHLVGNIMNDSLSNLLDSEKQKKFGMAKSILPQFCRDCEVQPMCNGECPKNRFMTTPHGEPGLNYLCQDYRIFFNHVRPFIEAVRSQWKAQRLPEKS